MMRMFSNPTTINLELTELCNVKCTHCYNFWRDDSMGSVSWSRDKIDLLIKEMARVGIFHVVLTGGEPMANFEVLEYCLRALREKGMSVSCNSNLMLATEDKIARLVDAGLDHILTSLPSHDPLINDKIMNSVGAFERIMKGIEVATTGGIRVSVNMVINRNNWHHVYKTAKLVAEKGATKLFVTRAVPPTYADISRDDTYDLAPDEVRSALDDAIRARDEFSIGIGSLVSYPLCFLGDLERYKDFVGRGCPSQSGHRMSINATGDTHVCVHEEQRYGNVLDSSITEIYQSRMRDWHDGSFVNPACQGCEYIAVCRSGCSMMAMGMSGSHEDKDPLFVGPQAFTRHFKVLPSTETLEAMRNGARFSVPRRLRFRQEDGFTLVSIRWANIISIENDVAAFLRRHQETEQTFSLEEFGSGRENLLAQLYFKDAVESKNLEFSDNRDSLGLSIDIADLIGGGQA